jgi:signal transduction histidine kinase
MVNVVRHAQATVCEVNIHLSRALEIEIRDNGRGVKDKREANPNGGIGLHSMRERAEELGGYCLIEALQPNGTKVLAFLPITEIEKGSESA